MQNRIVDLLDSWISGLDDYAAEGIPVQYQRYELDKPKPLMREMLDTDFESEHHRKFRVKRSLRDVEPEVNLFLKDLSGDWLRRSTSERTRHGTNPPQPGNHDLGSRRAHRLAETLRDHRRP